MERNIKRKTYISTLILCLLSGLEPMWAQAEETVVVEEVGILPAYVVVATRTPLGLDRVSPSIDYIGNEEIELWKDRDLVDTLERIPGVALKTSGATGNVASMFVRGANSDQTAIFIDGRRLNPTFSGQYDLESLSVTNLQSVQILKGGASVNYGSSGIGGVIDLRTQGTATEEGLRGSATAEFGSNGYRLFGLETTYSDDRLSFSVGGTALKTENEHPHDTYERFTILPQFYYKLNEHLSVELVSQYSESDKDLPGSLSSSSWTDYSETESWLLSPGFRYATDLLSVHLFYSRSSYIGKGVNYSPFYNEITCDEVNLQADYSASESLLLSLGGSYRKDDVYRRGLYQNKLQQAGVFGQAIWLVSDAFELRGGLRFDDFSDYDSAVTSSLEAIYTVSDCNLSFFAKLSTAYAPPSGQDLAYDENIDSGSLPIDTPLNPEESVSYEIGVRQELLDEKLEWSLLFFRNEIDALIVYQDYSYYDTIGTYIYVGSDTYNVESATTEGLEFQLDFAFCEKLTGSLAYTYLTAKNDDLDARLLYRPRHLLQIGLDYDLLSNLKFATYLVGQFDREGGYIYNGQVNYDIEDFVTVDLNITWSINDQWDLFTRVGNLLDESYAVTDGYPSLGRMGIVGLKYVF